MKFQLLKIEKLIQKIPHGTGCTLASAIATYYSCGKTLKRSCEMAIKYVNHAIGTRTKIWKRSWTDKPFKYNKYN